MSKLIDLTGKHFGRWMVLNIDPIRRGKHSRVNWICKCNCGTIKSIPSYSLRDGSSKSCTCYRDEIRKRKGKFHPNWKGGKIIDNQGYIRILVPNHSNTDHHGYVAEHHFIMSEKLGRPINTKIESVHHINGIKTDNRIENLELKVCHHGKGQTVEDMIQFCINYLREYKPEVLKNAST